MPGLVERIVCGDERRASLKVIGGMIPYPPYCLCDAMEGALHENLGDPYAYPGLTEMVGEVVSFASKASLGRVYPGWVTSGATESNILALYAAREEGYTTVIRFSSAHYSISKAARILGMREVVVESLGGFAANIEGLEEALEENPGSLVVATLGTTETGYLDPVPDMARLARRYDSILHIDAAFTGPLLAYLGSSKAPKALDATVRTMAVDLHKIPEAPLGVGVLLAYSNDLLESLWFEAPYLPSGRQFGILGSRPAAPLAAASMIARRIEPHMGEIAEALMDSTREVYDELVERGPYGAPHPPESPLICLTHPMHRRVHGRLQALGYRAYQCPTFGGVRLAIMPHVLGGVLREWVEVLRRVA
ncbi:MAG: aminotransferase class V-fold PLP-dependent enzyme [Desulfurococcales archaeon]|nr:aminotransferase class V-fold PLP-dependent enzyme [Desulfurococcales archaeon]